MMKRIYTILVAILLTTTVFAQAPEKMSYQAVVRNANDQLVTGQEIGMQISILQGSPSGTAVYVETQTPTTNANGLVSLEIGTGTVESGDFSTIDWANGIYFIKTETDLTGGENYTITGTTQLMSVPYALHAKTAESITGNVNYTESDPVFTNSEANNITAQNITDLGNLSGVNTGDQDLSTLATKTALENTATEIRAEIPDVGNFVTSESDPIFTNSAASNITAQNITDLGNLSGVNTGDQDLSALATKTALENTATEIRSEIPDVSNFITSENDPLYTQSVASGITGADTSNWNNATQSLSITGNQITISSGNTINLPDAGSSSNVPVRTTTEIASLTPEEGEVVYNSTENLYQIYQGGAWHAFDTNCWPKPTVAVAGADQTFTDGTASATLSANTPDPQHGTGSWTIISGTGGSFADDSNPNTTFTGAACTTYTLLWTISTSCSSSSDTINIEFNQSPPVADAGVDQTFNDGTVSATLSANAPASQQGTGSWSIVSGTGGNFADATDPNTTFTGTLHNDYTLQWTISTNCNSSTDDVTITFNQDGAGEPLTDYDGNTYNTVHIGNQLWMAEDLKTTHEPDGTSIPTVTDDNSSGSTNDEWEALGDNDTDKAYSTGPSGTFYTYSAAKDVCPTDWHLPSDEEWTALENYISDNGFSDMEGTALKSTTDWEANGNGTDDFGFGAYPVGSRYDGAGTFDGAGYNGNWWSSTASSTSSAYFRFLNYSYPYVYRFSFNKSNGFSVRCIKDK